MNVYGVIPWNCIVLILFLQTTSCFPLDKISTDPTIELKDETQFPNGTVVGKYSYKDNDGNPVQVKYFADDSSYGVELNSIKVLKTSTPGALQQLTTNMDYMKPMEPLLDLASEIMSYNRPTADKYGQDFNTDKKNNIDNHVAHVPVKTAGTNSPDYETFYQNEVIAPKQCEQNKVRVYLVKEKRKSRSLFEDDQASQYCEQF